MEEVKKVLANCPQALSSDEKLQARSNIGALSGVRVETPSGTTDLVPDSQGRVTVNLTDSVNVQSDWNQSNSAEPDYIKNKPSIPEKTSDLQNDSGFITAASVPTKTSDLQNDSGFITAASLPTFSGGLTENSGTVTVDNPMPAPTFGVNSHAYLRATDNPMAGEPDTVEWVQPFHVLGWDSGSTWEEVDLMSLKVQDTPQGDWGVQATGDGISMSGLRYLVPTTVANSFLKADANGKMAWESIPDLDVDYLVADGIEYYNLDSGDNYITLPWDDSRATILQLQSDASVDIYLETDSTTTVHSMLILANAGQGGVYYCAHVVVHYNDELGNARTWDIPFGTSNQGVIIDAFMKKVGSGLSATSIGRVTVRKQDEAVQF